MLAVVANSTRNGLSICFQCQGENLSELASEAGLAWDMLSEQLQAESCDDRKCRTAWSIQAVVQIGGGGGEGETWLSGHVTSGP